VRLLELTDRRQLAALAVHPLHRLDQRRHLDRLVAAGGDERGALGRYLDVAARQLEEGLLWSGPVDGYPGGLADGP
jgi:hypothetical protein